YLHGAGAGGRWLPFQARLAERFDLLAPSHPGHGGSPAAEWIEHISDLAFHYLDLLDTLGLDRVHVLGASFGGWIAAELATMASPGPHHDTDAALLGSPRPAGPAGLRRGVAKGDPGRGAAGLRGIRARAAPRGAGGTGGGGDRVLRDPRERPVKFYYFHLMP